MNRSTRDPSILDLVGDPGDEALRAALLELASLAEVPAPAPSDALAAVFEARPGPGRTRRSPGRIAGGTTAFVGLLVASGTAAAALGGAIPWADDEPAAPPAAAVRPSQPGHAVTPDAYAGRTPHAHSSPRTTRATSDEGPLTAQQTPGRTTVSPTDLPRAFGATSRPRLTAAPRTTSVDAPSDATAPADGDAQVPHDPNEPQGKPVKPAKPPTADKPDATPPPTSLRRGPGEDGEPTDPSTLATDSAGTTEDPTTEDPTTEDPTTKDPTTKDPATKDAATKDAATKDAATKDAATKDPATEDPRPVTDGDPAQP